MTDCDALLAGIVSDPLEETRWLVLADWLEEYDDPRRAELLRFHRRMLATCCEPDSHPERAAWQSRMTELLIAGVKPCVPQETLTLPGSVPMTFSFIPPGAFLMGSEKGSDDEKPVRRVEVSQGFFMGIYPVTQAQWLAVMGTDPSGFKGQQRPVESVSWNDCQQFCSMLSESTGRTVELATEVEWEFTCRAGTTTEYYFGDVLCTDLANYNGNRGRDGSPEEISRKGTTNVGSFPANPWGVCDVHGNVWEWCMDLYDKQGSGPRAGSRLLRGGSWSDGSDECYAACRVKTMPTSRYYDFGFRVCLRLS
jgi:uncharacterized protein (TIGR02996 family)